MNQEFNIARNVYLDRDEQGVVRQLLHIHAPVAIQAGTPQLAAADYLHQFGEPLALLKQPDQSGFCSGPCLSEDRRTQAGYLSFRKREASRNSDPTAISH